MRAPFRSNPTWPTGENRARTGAPGKQVVVGSPGSQPGAGNQHRGSLVTTGRGHRQKTGARASTGGVHSMAAQFGRRLAKGAATTAVAAVAVAALSASQAPGVPVDDHGRQTAADAQP